MTGLTAGVALSWPETEVLNSYSPLQPISKMNSICPDCVVIVKKERRQFFMYIIEFYMPVRVIFPKETNILTNI